MKIIAIGMNYRTGYFYETGFCLAERQQAFFYSRFL